MKVLCPKLLSYFKVYYELLQQLQLHRPLFSRYNIHLIQFDFNPLISISYYSSVNQMNSSELVQFFSNQINKIRTDPQSFIPILESRLQRFDQNNQYSHYEFGNILFQTIDGKSAVKNAIQNLQNLKPRKQILLSQQLCQAAYQIGSEIQSDRCTEVDLDIYKQKIKTSLQKNTTINDQVQAIVQYGFRKDLDVLASIIIDDGNPQKSKRQILLGEKYKSIGISVHQHPQFDFFVLFLVSQHEKPIGCQCLLI